MAVTDSIPMTDEKQCAKIRVLSVSWSEIARDLERAIEFDQSQLFRRIYSDEFGTPGGEPKPTDQRRPEEAPPTQKGPSDKTESTSEHTGLLVEHSPTALG